MTTEGQGHVKNNEQKKRRNRESFIKNWKHLFPSAEKPFFLNSHDPMKS